MKAEATQFTAAILHSRLCLRCISIKADIVEHRLGSLIRSVQRTMTVIETVDQCDDCGRQTVVYRLQ